MDADRPLVSIVMPVLNERRDLERAFEAIDRQTYPRDCMEILVVDGGSTDGTVDLVKSRAAADPRLALLGGPGISTPAAMEVGIAASTGDLVAKVDGHGWINERFIETAVAEVQADPAVGCAGGRIVPVAETAVQRAIAIARFSRLGVGGGVYTLGSKPRDAETVQCGVYRRHALIESGGFDPDLPYGEDEEANFRLRQHGWRIRFNPAMQFHYRVRPSISALLRQYFRYGRARVAVVRKHPTFLRPKHAAPAVLVAGLASGAAASVVPGLRPLGVAAWVAYASLVVGGGIALALKHRFPRPDLVAASLAALHLGYGLGTLRGLLSRPLREAPASR